MCPKHCDSNPGSIPLENDSKGVHYGLADMLTLCSADLRRAMQQARVHL